MNKFTWIQQKQTKETNACASASLSLFSSVLKGVFLILFFTAILTSCATSKSSVRKSDYSAPIRVACVGDSITYGYGIKDREHESYPAQLAVLLGKKWDVRNFGFNGATVLKKGTRPYSQLAVYREALAFKPNVVVVKLGTNDTNDRTWPSHKDDFLADYLELIRSFHDLESKPRIYLCRPVPLFRDRGKNYDTDKILTEEVIPKINEVARQKHLPLIDLYAALETRSDLFADGVHPDVRGAKIIAETVHANLVDPSKTNSSR